MDSGGLSDDDFIALHLMEQKIIIFNAKIDFHALIL